MESAPPHAAPRTLEPPADAPDPRHRLAGRLGTGDRDRLIKVDVYHGSYDIQIGIQLAGKPHAKATVKLRLDELHQLRDLLDQAMHAACENQAIYEAQQAQEGLAA